MGVTAEGNPTTKAFIVNTSTSLNKIAESKNEIHEQPVHTSDNHFSGWHDKVMNWTDQTLMKITFNYD